MRLHKPLQNTPSKHNILCASFNQDMGCFAVGHQNGFSVYNTDPLECRVYRDSPGSIGHIQMLYRTNYIALVGGGSNPKFSQNNVVIWDDLKNHQALSLEFFSPVLNVLLSRTWIVVCIKSKIHIYGFSSPPLRMAVYDTVENPLGVCVMSASKNLLAFPARTEGQIQIVDLSPIGTQRNLVSIIKAHKTSIKSLALSSDGLIVASASDIGTIIRIHSTSTTALLHEFRRGLDRASIYSMSFSPSSNRLALLSDKGTLHIFDTCLHKFHSEDINKSTKGKNIITNQNINTTTEPSTSVNDTPPEDLNNMSLATNRRHILAKVPLLPRYFSSEWSFVSTKVRDDPISSKGIVGWTSDDSIIVIFLSDACWEKYIITEQEKERESFDSFHSHDSHHSSSRWQLLREGWRSLDET